MTSSTARAMAVARSSGHDAAAKERVDVPAFVEASIFVNRFSNVSTPSVTRLIVLTTSAERRRQSTDTRRRRQGEHSHSDERALHDPDVARVMR